MDAKQQIRAFLNDPKAEYLTGIALLQSYGPVNSVAKQLLEVRNIHRLRDELKNVLLNLVEVKTPVPLPKSATVTPKKLKVTKSELPISAPELPKAAARALESASLSYRTVIKQIDTAKGHLFAIGRDSKMKPVPLTQEQKKQRFELAKQLVGLDKSAKEIAESKSYILANGRTKRKSKTAGVTSTDNYLLKENTRKHIAKLKRDITMLEQKQRSEKTLLKIAEKKSLLEHKKDLLNKLNNAK